MPDITKGKTFISGETVTATELNSMIDNAVINNLAIDSNKLAADAVTNAKVAAAAGIEWGKMQTLPSGNILVGNSDNQPTAVSMSGDVTISNTGAMSIGSGTIETGMIADDAVTADKLANTSVTAGSYTNADVTVDAQGRVTAAENGAPAKVIQVVHASTDATTFSHSSATHGEVTGLSATITPTSTSNKILIEVMLTHSGHTDLTTAFGLKRDSTQIGSSGEATGSRMSGIASSHTPNREFTQTIFYRYYDTPATTSAVVYKPTVAARLTGSSQFTFQLNKPFQDDNSGDTVYGISSITVSEISA